MALFVLNMTAVIANIAASTAVDGRVARAGFALAAAGFGAAAGINLVTPGAW